MRRIYLTLLMVALVAAVPNRADAGFIIIDGTDANDHGSASGGMNLGGWEYMQRVLENLASSRLAANPGVTKTIYNVGANVGSQSGNAITSAFALSGLSGSGWTLINVNGAAAINTLLGSLNANTNGILAFSTASNSGGDLDSTEVAAINANAANIETYLGAGGALHAMAQSGTGANGYLTTLLPGLVVTDVGGGGIFTTPTLTAAGFAAFPGLTNADIGGATPWHNYFSGNLGGLSVLGTAPDGSATRNLILGGAGGTIVLPPNNAVPAPAGLVLGFIGMGFAGLTRRLWTKKA